MKKALIFATLLIAGTTAAEAEPGDWVVLGYKHVGLGTDHDVIDVNAHAMYRKLQLCAFDAPVEMNDFDVHYGNGMADNIPVRSVIAQGSCTRVIDLRGGKRHITRISLRYSRLGLGVQRPLVRVMGR